MANAINAILVRNVRTRLTRGILVALKAVMNLFQ